MLSSRKERHNDFFHGYIVLYGDTYTDTVTSIDSTHPMIDDLYKTTLYKHNDRGGVQSTDRNSRRGKPATGYTVEH
jgi:hypothetical protein